MYNIAANVKASIFLFIYYCFFKINQSLIAKEGIFILCYHGVAHDNWKYSINFEDLEKQLKYLSKHYHPISMGNLQKYMQGKLTIAKPSFVVTFDDGYKDVFRVKDLVKSLGITPTLFVMSDRIKANRNELATKRPFLTKKEIFTLIKNGWTVGSHSATHANFKNMSIKQIEKEVVTSKIDLEKELGIPVKYFAYPKGIFDESIIKTVKTAGYKAGFTATPGRLNAKTNRFTIPRFVIGRNESIYFVLSYYSLPAEIVRNLFRNVYHLFNKTKYETSK